VRARARVCVCVESPIIETPLVDRIKWTKLSRKVLHHFVIFAIVNDKLIYKNYRNERVSSIRLVYTVKCKSAVRYDYQSCSAKHMFLQCFLQQSSRDSALRVTIAICKK